MRKALAVLVAAIGALALALPASASVAPRNVVGSIPSANGEAGFYTQEPGVMYSRVNAVISLQAAAANLGPVSGAIGPGSGAVGIELCNQTTGYAAQVGVLEEDTTPATFEVGFGEGTLADCATGGLLGSGSLPVDLAPALTGIPVTDSVVVQVKNVGHGVLFSAAVELPGGQPLASYSRILTGGPAHFDLAGAGVVQDAAMVAACGAVCPDELAAFSGVTATSGKYTRGFARWDAVSVQSEANGSVFVAPGALTPAVFTVTVHKGHWSCVKKAGRERCRWVKRYTTRTGLGPSSFTVSTGEPVGS